MARVTVEDCILNEPNRFDLVIVAAQRAKQISSGIPLTVDRDNDKDAVVALREIADSTIDRDGLKEEIIQNFQKRHGFDPTDTLDEEETAMAQGQTRASDIAEAFEDAQQFISDDKEEGGQDANFSFVEENIEVED